MTAIVVVAGPTGTGKTGAALELARRLGGELVGADSVQVYRGFDIGSAKPTDAELGGVAHHLIDVTDPDTGIDAADYAALADAAIEAIRARGNVPIVVGGTGLWLRALVRGLVDVPKVDPELRARLEAEYEAAGPAAAHARLAEVDALSAATIHENDAIRVVRALEVHAQTGQALGQLRAAHALGAPRYRAFFAVLDADREQHRAQLELRFDAMIAAGWLDELRDLLASWDRSCRAFGSVGYRQLVAHVADDESFDDARQKAIKATRVYARRQRTWFGSEPGTHWRGTAAELTSGSLLSTLAAHLGSP